ncbi:protein of unknown function DUF1321 [Ancylobacter novellus DSM 506]|uniref:Stringent starvation protein B n=1 Tax=Ancylobacter novellus (strain ATCC 8093 / DSM 506 / JCM 20403 / CCM 1077 / IAM 12100 / NBRC 12443 / NCIMB 10456) TaxID=639283 RepID=D7A7D8_ANCN5|nr:ClpXP protease specificity-enhancing factor SspB [Ancylobacter novellus]ADH90369.1 protein of unknown function DUF1321 [Ancylobacter novellus DSM 506]
MSVDLIRYDLLVQDALRSVVRRVLTDVARDGLPGDHHLYVSFDTRASGVRLSPRLKERYPEEMTIVLQHQFWDLIVSDQFFEVGLSFNGIPERLHIPFAALKGFFDPSVKFGLQFEPVAEEDEDAEDEAAAPAPVAPVTPIGEARPTSVPSTRAAARPAKEAAKLAPKTESRPAPAKPTPVPAAKAEPKPVAVPKADKASEKSSDKPAAKGGEGEGKDDGKRGGQGGAQGGAQVVRLDTFRKK